MPIANSWIDTRACPLQRGLCMVEFVTESVRVYRGQREVVLVLSLSLPPPVVLARRQAVAPTELELARPLQITVYSVFTDSILDLRLVSTCVIFVDLGESRSISIISSRY